MKHAPATTTTTDTTPTGEALQLEIVTTLGSLLELVPLVAALADSHQRGLGFMSYDARQVENAMIRKERRDLIIAMKDGKPTGHGTTRAPGNITALSAWSEIWATAHHQVWRLTRWLARNGIEVTIEPVDDQVPTDGATLVRLLHLLRPMVWETTDDQVLLSVRDDLDHSRDLAERLIDGNDRILLDVPCPHCGRRTLVVTFKDGVITCGKDHATGIRHPCTCNDPLCECKDRPVAHQHTWYRIRGHRPGGWEHLAKQIRNTKGTRP